MISGRFQITNAGTGNGNINISLPTGFNCQNGGYGGCGFVTPDNPDHQFMARYDGNATIKILQGGSGGTSLPNIGTGYVGVFAVLALA